MDYRLTAEEVQTISAHFGAGFCHKVTQDLEKYGALWKLDGFQLVDYFSVNCIFFCRSEQYGEAVLKIGEPCRETMTEYHTLRQYDGQGFCRVYAADLENGVLLIERIRPGRRLREEPSLKKRLTAFLSVYQGLHREPARLELYPTYLDWVTRITAYMSQRKDYPELSRQMKKAEALCRQIGCQYPKRMLLHGDLHHDNLLLSRTGEYRIIDPKGVIGDPVFDIARFILNEDKDGLSAAGYRHKIETIIDFLAEQLKIPGQTLKQCYFIETAMANCWQVESGQQPDMDGVVMAERIMNNR